MIYIMLIQTYTETFRREKSFYDDVCLQSKSLGKPELLD